MESSEEEDSIENHPSLPPNYLSLAQLRDQWLQKQKKKQIDEEAKQNQEQEKEREKQKQPERQGKLVAASQRLRQEKGKKKVVEEEPGRGRNAWKRVEGSQKFYVSQRALGANTTEIGGDERQLKSEECTKQGSTHQGVAGVGGQEETIAGERKKKKKKRKNWGKRGNRANGNPVGALESPENLEDSNCIDDGEDKRKGGLGRNATGNREVEGKINVSMNGVVPDYKGELVNLFSAGGKCGHDEEFKVQDLGNQDDHRLVHTVFSVSTVKWSPKSMAEEKVHVARNGVDQEMLEAGNVGMAAVSPELNREDCSVSVGRNKRGEGRASYRHKRNVHNLRNTRDSSDSKMELGCEKNVEEERVLDKEHERNGMQKEKTDRAAQPGGDKTVVEDNLTPKIRRDLRFLSLEENKEGNAALRKGQHGRPKRGFGKSKDGFGNSRDSTDSKMELGCEKNVEDESALDKEHERNAVQKERTARAAYPNDSKTMVEDNLTPKIGKDLKFLSLDGNKEGNVALRKGQHGWRKRGFGKSKDPKGLVWVKKGENSDSNAAAT
ncbi:OLC1v1017045C1 [Oldenlandia corymbosa var. corymbosa]|uniref:OLC1v1017045C1 n=1 Tax=Oldenlandia corymbosa var. corymbosa TaxID=529605 RepID=A0AAV1E8I4_OLDCO|nr:OLC1v1017045C1 [Oldenlandia corymbosa var. corymbosa]